MELFHLSWIERANQRWQEWKESEHEEINDLVLGCDIAAGGDDKTYLRSAGIL